MRVLRSRAFAAVAVVAAFASTPASAAELGFYVGFMYGDRSKDFDTAPFTQIASEIYEGLEYSPEVRTFTTEDYGESYGFLAGYRLTRNIAIEGGYMSIGKQSYRESSNGFFFPSDDLPQPEEWGLSLTSETSGFAVSALGILPISYSWEVYARAGVFFGSSTLSVWANSAALNGAATNKYTDSSTDWLAGAGISMSLAEVYTLRAEFTRIFDAGTEAFGEADADLVSIGITVAF